MQHISELLAAITQPVAAVDLEFKISKLISVFNELLAQKELLDEGDIETIVKRLIFFEDDFIAHGFFEEVLTNYQQLFDVSKDMAICYKLNARLAMIINSLAGKLAGYTRRYQQLIRNSVSCKFYDQVVDNLINISNSHFKDFFSNYNLLSPDLSILEVATTSALAAVKLALKHKVNVKQIITTLIPKVIYQNMEQVDFKRLVALNRAKPESLANIFNSLAMVAEEYYNYGHREIAETIYTKLIAWAKEYSLGEDLLKRVRSNLPKVGSETLKVSQHEFLKQDYYLNKLHTIRAKYSTQVKQKLLGQSLAAILHEFTKEMDNLVEQLFTDCFELLGKPPRKYAILALGSLSRNEMCPYSDLEFAILIEDAWVSDCKKYFALLMQLLTIKIAALGETPSKDLETKLLKKGFSLDDGGNIPFGGSMQLIGTAKELISKLQPINPGAELLRPESMDGSNALWFNRHLLGDQELTEQFRVELDQLSFLQDYALYMLKDCLKNESFEAFAEEAKEILIKPKLLSFVSFILSDLCLYYGISKSNNYERLVELKSRRMISEELAKLLEFYLDIVFNLRFATHNESGSEYEKLKITAQNRELLLSMRVGVLEPLRVITNEFVANRANNFLTNKVFAAATNFCLKLGKLVSNKDDWSKQLEIYSLGLEFAETEELDIAQKQMIELLEQEKQALAALANILKDLPQAEADDLEVWHEQVSRKAIKKYTIFYKSLLQLEDLNKAQSYCQELSINLPNAAHRAVLLKVLKYYKSQRAQVFKAVVERTPERDGSRVCIEQEKQRLVAALWDLTTTDVTRQALTVVDITMQRRYERYLMPDIVNQLIENGEFKPKPKDQGGRHVVLPTIKSNKKLWWKLYPEQPGNCYAWEQLSWRLVGSGTVMSTVVKLKLKNKVAAIQVIQDVGDGELLSKVLRDEPEKLSRLNHKSFTQQFIRTLILNPEDDKSDDYYLVGNILGDYDLVRIDNDRALFDAEEKGKWKDWSYNKLLVKSIIFCLDQMSKPLDELVIKDFLELNPYLLLKSWLQELKKLHSNYLGLFKENVVKEHFLCKEPGNSLLTVMIPEVQIRALNNRIIRLQQAFRGISNPTGRDVLQNIQSVLSGYYLNMFKDYPITARSNEHALSRFLQLTASLYGIKKQGVHNHLQTHISSIEAFSKTTRLGKFKEQDALLVWQGQANSPQQCLDLIESANLPTEDSLSQIRQDILAGRYQDYKWLSLTLQTSLLKRFNKEMLQGDKYTQKKQRNILGSIALGSFQILQLSPYNEVLTDKQLKNIIKGCKEQLLELDITGCGQITEKSINELGIYCSQLRQLRASNLPKLKSFGKLGMIEALTLGSLELLQLSASHNLATINISSHKLKRLDVNGCVKLEGLQTNSEKLEYIDISHCHKLGEEVLRVFVPNAKTLVTLKTSDYEGRFLHMAVHNNYKKVVDELLQKGVAIEEKNKAGLTALHIATEDGNIELVKQLIESGANINALTKDNETMLHIAVHNNYKKVVDELLQKGVAIEEKNKAGLTALHVATEAGNIELVKQLIESGANINALTKDNETMLHVAVKNNNIKIIGFLLEQGVNPLIEVADKKTAVELVKKRVDQGMIKAAELERPLMRYINYIYKYPKLYNKYPKLYKLLKSLLDLGIEVTTEYLFKLFKIYEQLEEEECRGEVKEQSIELDQKLLARSQNILIGLGYIIKESQGREQLCEKLLALVKSSKTDERSILRASNAITVLNYAGYSLSGRDLRGIKIPGAELSGAIMDGADLTGADLTGVRLSHAYLRNSNFRQANLNGVVLGERAYLEQGSSVLSVAYSSDGTKLATGSLDGTVRLWEVSSSCELSTLPGHTYYVNSVTYSPDGLKLAAGSSDHTVRLWEVSSGRELSTLCGHASSVRSVTFSPDSRKLATGSEDNMVMLWEVSSGRVLRTLSGHAGTVTSVTFSPDGRKLASGSEDNTVKLWGVSGGRELHTLRGHTWPVNSVAYSPDGRRLATGSSDHTVRLWEVSSGRELRTLRGHSNWVLSVTFSPDGRRLATGSSDHTVRLWEVSSGRELRTLCRHSDWVLSVTYSPNGTKLATGSYDKTVRLWEVSSSCELSTPRGHIRSVNSVTYSPDGRKLATGSSDNTVKLWDVSSGRKLCTLRGHIWSVNSVTYSPDGRKLATGGDDKTVKIWEVSSGRKLCTLRGHTYTVASVTYSPDGTKLATGSWDETARLWEVSSGRELYTLRGHFGTVASVTYSPDGTKLATGSSDHTVRLWEVVSGRELSTLCGHYGSIWSVTYSPDGRKLATGSEDNTVVLWELSSGRKICTLHGHADSVKSVTFSPDGRILATGSDDKTVRLWETSSGRELTSLRGHTDSVLSVTYSPDGKFLATGSLDHSHQIWAIKQEGRQIDAQVIYSSNHSLFLGGANFKDATGLSGWDEDLLKQRGAKNVPKGIRSENPQWPKYDPAAMEAEIKASLAFFQQAPAGKELSKGDKRLFKF